MTPQVARIDAHLLNRAGSRAPLLRGFRAARAPAGLFATREPIQIGAEIYGHAGIEADLEVLELMLGSLRAAGVAACASGSVPCRRRARAARARSLDRRRRGLRASSAEGRPGPARLLSPGPSRRMRATRCLRWSTCTDRRTVPSRRSRVARRVLPALAPIGAPSTSSSASRFAALGAASRRSSCRSTSPTCADYRYHTGITFAAYVDGMPNAVGRGGRYDDVGQTFGRARPATGFSLELRELASLQAAAEPGARSARRGPTMPGLRRNGPP